VIFPDAIDVVVRGIESGLPLGDFAAGLLAVMSMVYLGSPDYVELPWTEKLGQLMLAGSAIWMGIGVIVMKKMINLDSRLDAAGCRAGIPYPCIDAAVAAWA